VVKGGSPLQTFRDRSYSLALLTQCLCCVRASFLLGGVLTFEPEEAKLERAPVPRITSEGLVYRSDVRGDSEFGTNVLKGDDNAAAAEAAATRGMPGYCGDRYYRAMAGGNGCN